MFIGSSMLLASSVIPGVPVSSSLYTNLSRYYKLDGDGVDSYGGQNATVTGAGFVTGKSGQGFDFANTTARSIVAPAFDPPGDFSVSMWAYVATGGGGDYAQVVGQMDGGSGNQNWVILSTFGIKFSYYNYGNILVNQVDMSGHVNSWTHVVFTRNSSFIRGYVNGSLIVGPTSATAPTSVPSANFRMGTRNDGYSAFNGKLDEVALWTRAITDSEVTELYNSGAGKFYPF